MRIQLTRRSTRRAGAIAVIAALALTLGACGGGDDTEDAETEDTTSETTAADTPPPTFAPDREQAFLEASKDSQGGKLATGTDSERLEIGRLVCQALKEGNSGKELLDGVRKEGEVTTEEATDEQLGFFFGVSVGALCPDQEEQLKKGL